MNVTAMVTLVLEAIVNTLRSPHFDKSFSDFSSIKLLYFEEPINKKTSLVRVMAWCRAGDKPLSDLVN